MQNLQQVLEKAVELKRIRTWEYSFINTITDQPCNLQVTGVGLASSGGGGQGIDDWYEVVILMDNLQLFFYHVNKSQNHGSYYCANTLDDLRCQDTSLGMIETAEDTVKWYPF